MFLSFASSSLIMMEQNKKTVFSDIGPLVF
jgi:hypothetical protein